MSAVLMVLAAIYVGVAVLSTVNAGAASGAAVLLLAVVLALLGSFYWRLGALGLSRVDGVLISQGVLRARVVLRADECPPTIRAGRFGPIIVLAPDGVRRSTIHLIGRVSVRAQVAAEDLAAAITADA